MQVLIKNFKKEVPIDTKIKAPIYLKSPKQQQFKVPLRFGGFPFVKWFRIVFLTYGTTQPIRYN